jgi:hypothetical protein
MKYVIIKVMGGLGNQLFQIANAYNLSKNYNRKLLLCKDNAYPRDLYWDTVLTHFKNSLITTQKYNQLRQKSQIYNWAMTRFEYRKITIDPSIEYFCIEGYYQTYKYFDKLEFQKTLKLDYYKEETPNQNDVALHIRRTDYTDNNFHKVISLDYYYNCLRQIISQGEININRVCIFSDDLNWCKSNFKFVFNNTVKIVFVHLSTDIEELCFMKEFKTIIIANSSFSWWAAYLGNNKKIYCPKNWFNKGCHLNTKDLRPEYWIQINDVKSNHWRKNKKRFDKNVFNVISLGSACCMKQNILVNLYTRLGPAWVQTENATNFFDWLICDFKAVSFVFENLMFRDDQFLSKENFTIKDVHSNPQKLHGGWKIKYRKVENLQYKLISLHDVLRFRKEVTKDFFDKYKRRFQRLYDKIVNNTTLHFIHCFDFQWLDPYYPTIEEINTVFKTCKSINPFCEIKLYFLVHPKFQPDKIQINGEIFDKYKKIDNVEVYFLKDKGFQTDWKADNLTFDEFFK